MAVSTSSAAGIIAGMNPLEYSSSQPYTLFIFQTIFVVVLAQLVHKPLSILKQPKVIAEVITGILLGPSVMGHIPRFTSLVFPTSSIPGLTLVANVGVCLLLFMVGCEVDVEFIKKNLKIAFSVGIFNMAVPFGLGCAIAVGLWNEYRVNDDDLQPIKFTTFMVFIAVAMCITAFPVLARIITELGLVKDRVGVVVLAAGITNDLIGWILLALSITLANSSKSEITAYICLVVIGWCLFVVYPLRFLLRKVLFKLDEIHTGPSQLGTTIILMLMFASAFFTDIIGVHPIFGAFIVGTIVPRENNYVIILTEKIEDLVNIVFVPLYFALAGLSVNLGLLNRGIDWAYIVCIVVVAMVGKIFGGFVAAKFCGLYKRESLSVGVLMSCKGIVEIVVLNTGLNAGIISQKTFSMFIVMALIATFLTTPLTLCCYPQSYRDSVQRRLAEKEESVSVPASDSSLQPDEYQQIEFKRLILNANNLENITTDLILLDHLAIPAKLPIHGVHIKSLTPRTADLLYASMLKDEERTENTHLNAILSILKIFSDLNSIQFTSEILYSLPQDQFKTLLSGVTYFKHDLLVLTMSIKDFEKNRQVMAELRKADIIDVHRCLFVNNNQELASKAYNESVDDKSLISTDTFLNPNSFEISTLLLVFTSSKMSQRDMVALKLFSVLILHRRISTAQILVEESNEIRAIILNDPLLAQNPNISVSAMGPNEIEKLYDRSAPSMNNLVIITNEKSSDPLVDHLVDQNYKLLLVY
ncbi:hypothetical protein OGAPHI_002746 [Ogataea philodendri]|uniref:Cation/H+ exchanger transmembrane domain-containing protein n=1 Tax=Ogataea philodendri TaxID=1378263 RepID=A0A9P8T8H0_9ASCO|nr:uncharacterized protein OGAPHI_002746 [Ogataea philodendri]KAH3668991.1 hypothetical protein OGAPHI_002746 [Ogataea philodendri]